MPPPRGKAAKETLQKVLPPPTFLCACKSLAAPSLLLHGLTRVGRGSRSWQHPCCTAACLGGDARSSLDEWRSTNATSACLSLHGSFPLGFMKGGGKKGFLLAFTSPGFCLAALGSTHWVMGGDHHPPPYPVLESALRLPGAVHDEDK